MIVAQSTVQCPVVAKTLGGGGIETEVEQSVVGNQILLALVTRLLIHTTNTSRQFPTVKLVGNVTQVVCQCVQLEIQLVLIHFLLELLTAVLLVADDGLEIARRQVQRVVPYHLVVLYLLEWECFRVLMSGPTLFVFQFTSLGIALSFNDSRC